MATVLEIAIFTLVMALIGARLILLPLQPLFRIAISHWVSPPNQMAAAVLAVKYAAGIITFGVGLLLGVPWYGCLIAGVILILTTTVHFDPGPFPDY